MGNSITAERRNKLAQIIVSNGSVRIGEIAELFHVTTETIRKDLIYLDNKGIIKKSHGGAIAASEFIERPITSRELENLDLKDRIAQRALEFVIDNGVIIIDAGSTALCLAKLLALRKGLTVITNSFSAANTLIGSPNNVYMTGGEISEITMSTTGLWASNALNMIKADVAFLGSSGFQSHFGPSVKSFADAEVKRNIISNSKKTIVLADSTKFFTNAVVQYVLWDNIDILITDDKAPEEMVIQIQKNTKVIIA